MLIERPPLIFRFLTRLLLHEVLFRVECEEKMVFLTFDDGPIPEVTPWVLNELEKRSIRATFFMVGQNVERHPELLEEVKRRGHSVGNHTMRHLQGSHVTTRTYLHDTERAAELIGTSLFRPPHGWLRPRQAWALGRCSRIVMYDLVTRDYSRWLNSNQVVRNVRKYARPGSIIVFHDSLKSWPRLQTALPESLDWLISQGYSFGVLDDGPIPPK
ncbi:MAG: polysaccharide deacetylase family protein [Clostridium sp.]|nr:polysaccharide deacetylase family protein [Prevotella sp.]MCM1429690.1 polysaccharide deacetylase family protein [Clostridium sp.]MCM1476155.1 polysaccharide deacetylase family protein [Muribaculaceae bacterium]